MVPRRTLPLIAATTLALTMTLAACGSGGTAGTSGTVTSPVGGSSSTAPAGSSGSSAASSASASGSGAASGSGSASGTSSPAGSSSPQASSGASSPAGSSGAGASGSDSTAASSAGPTALPADCTPAQLQTQKPGVLTIATDEPVYEPWFVDDKPENGKGFEGAVAYAVATKLGYAKDKVSWVRAHFDAVISPAPKDFDFDINEFSITADRAKVVDFSSGYYDVTQAVVTTKGSPIAGAKSVADLAKAHLGAQLGTTSLDAINEIIKPSSQPAVFQTNDAAVQALKNGQIDGIVTDLPTAFYMTGAQLDDGVLVGQLPATSAKPEQFGLLLEKDSPLTSCLSAAVDALRADGTLADLAQQWLTKSGAPELK